ncbi:hypothetical protein LTR86_007401 [Recurvomyces mirabilis]|nr:hypothetical protein LTR86_007401 [Recurvomyces mirabilis]
MAANHGTKRKGSLVTDCDDGKRSKISQTVGCYVPPQRPKRSNGVVQFSCTAEHASEAAHLQDSYVHSPLMEPDAIRCLTILPGDEADGLSCSLQVVRLRDDPVYEALSYSWGAEPATCPIRLHDKTAYIRPNLLGALRVLRHKYQEVRVWVDALCINQANDIEKDHQVSRMGRIYSKAQRTIIWLGEHDASSRQAMTFVAQILNPDFLSRDTWLDDQRILALGRFLTRPWFSRRWIVQEVILAKESTMVVGSSQVHFTDIVDAVEIVKSRLNEIRAALQQPEHYRSYELNLLSEFEDSRAVRLLNSTKDMFLRSNNGTVVPRSATLEELMFHFRGFQNSDLRDSVYALLSLGADTASSPIKVDYSRNVVEVFADFAISCAHKSGSLDVMLRSWGKERKKASRGDTRNWPSWIPDFHMDDGAYDSVDDNSTSDIHTASLVGSPAKRKYQTLGQAPASVRFSMRLETLSLRVNGFVLGNVEQLSTRMADGIVLKECLDMIGGITRDQAGNVLEIDDVCWRICCADRDPEGEQAPSLYRMAMFQLLQQGTCPGSIDTQELLEKTNPPHLRAFLKRIQAVVWNRRVFLSSGRSTLRNDLLGLAPRNACVNDRICMIYGCSVPVILRPHQSGQRTCYILVGEAYVDGIMDGQLIQAQSSQSLQQIEEEFEIA